MNFAYMISLIEYAIFKYLSGWKNYVKVISRIFATIKTETWYQRDIWCECEWWMSEFIQLFTHGSNKKRKINIGDLAWAYWLTLLSLA